MSYIDMGRYLCTKSIARHNLHRVNGGSARIGFCTYGTEKMIL